MMLNVVANDCNDQEIDVVDYNVMINKINNKKRLIQRKLNEIKERIENRQDIRYGIVKNIDHLNYIENIKDYSGKNNITINLDIPYDIMLDFHKCIELKHGYNYPISKSLVGLISKFNESYLDTKQQHSTSSFLKYKNKEPRLDVLLKLKDIINLIYSEYPDGVVSQQLIKQSIKEELNADPRTAENYLLCIKNFAEKMMNERLGYYSRWNLRGIKEAIDEKLQKRGKLGAEND